MTDEESIYGIVRLARTVHAGLGPGFIESIYARALIAELKNSGFRVEREKLIKIWYGVQLVGKHRLDLLVNAAIIVELKASRGVIPLHKIQMRSYLHATTYPYGLILNFGMPALEWEWMSAASVREPVSFEPSI